MELLRQELRMGVSAEAQRSDRALHDAVRAAHESDLPDPILEIKDLENVKKLAAIKMGN